MATPTLGNDTLIGGTDTLKGLAGNDTYVISDISQVITELLGEGIDTVETNIADYTLTAANVENLKFVTGTNTAFKATGNGLNNIITGGAGDDTLSGGLGKDTLIGGAGNDVYIIDSITDKIVDTAGTDRVESSVTYTLGTGIENLTLTGTGIINGTGNAGDNTITGNTAANILDGGSAGTDVLIGGLGNDIYLVNSATVTVTEASGAGTDLVKASVNYTLLDNVENLELVGFDDINGTGNTGANKITGNFGNNELNGGTGIDTLIGGTGDDTYVVDSTTDTINELTDEGTDTVKSSVNYTLTASNVENIELTGTAANATGNALNNQITGNASPNTLNGGAGIDTLIGGAGDDIYVVDSTTDTITEVTGEGTDTIQSTVTYSLANTAQFAGLEFVENLTLTGTGVIKGTGNAGNNTITGNNAANTLDGGSAGTDVLVGLGGNDIYLVNSATVTVTEDAAKGLDTVKASVNYTLLDNVEILELSGTATTGTGNALDNKITGTDNADTLSGLLGKDTLIGGKGNDTYTVDNILDVVTETALVGSGTDLINSSVNYTLPVNVENLTLTGLSNLNGTGNISNNTITGNDGNNKLTGAAGIDTLIGGLGDDTYIIDTATDTITEAASGGSDTVQSSVSYTLAAEVETLTLTGTAAINGTGNAIANTITGNGAVNTLTGVNANDILVGGNGNDIYIIDSTTGYTITEVATTSSNLPGIADLVKASVNYTLPDNVEKLELTGTGGLTGTGNALKNEIKGNDGADTLSGGTGLELDTLIGGKGNDTYVVDNTGDVVTETALTGAGTDTVESSATYTLPINVEKLTLTGSANINGTGNTSNNTINGNTGNNELNGGAGKDTLIGGLGDDTYTIDSTTDTLTEALGAGTDTVKSSVTYTLPGNIEKLILTGTGANLGSGNVLDNTITGNASANTLNGNAGADTLDGAGGNDILNGGAGTDSLIGGEGNDTLTGGTEVDNLTGSGGADAFKFGLSTEGQDIITDFSVTDDSIQIVSSTFDESLNLGVITVDQFVLGAAATTADHRFGYNSTNGDLWYDSDGDGANALVNFAKLSTSLSLTNADIVVI